MISYNIISKIKYNFKLSILFYLDYIIIRNLFQEKSFSFTEIQSEINAINCYYIIFKYSPI
jgi:hypothetical protein